MEVTFNYSKIPLIKSCLQINLYFEEVISPLFFNKNKLPNPTDFSFLFSLSYLRLER